MRAIACVQGRGHARLRQAGAIREKELGCDVLTHQKWSGAGYIDGILGAIQSGSSGSKSMGEGNTETGMFENQDGFFSD